MAKIRKAPSRSGGYSQARRGKNIKQANFGDALYKYGSPAGWMGIPKEKAAKGLLGGWLGGLLGKKKNQAQNPAGATPGLPNSGPAAPAGPAMNTGMNSPVAQNKNMGGAPVTNQFMKKGGSARKKMQAGGVAGKSPKAGLVDPNGAWTKVQKRNLGSMKNGGKLGRSEKQMGLGIKSKAHGDINPAKFRKAQLKSESQLMGKRSGELAPYKKSSKK